jgi:stringent starvation protein B
VSRRPYIKELPRAYREEYDAEVEANPAVIVWAKRHGVFIPVEVYDPLADAPNRKQTRRNAG